MTESEELGKVLKKRLRILEESDTPDAIKELLRYLHPDKNRYAMWQAEEILRRKVSRKHADILIDYLNSEEEKHRWGINLAIELLGQRVGLIKAIPAISRYINHKDEIVRAAVVQELGRIKSRKGIPIILKGLDDDSPFVLVLTCDALIWIGDASIVDYLKDKLSKSKSYFDKLYLSYTLYMLGDESKLDYILKSLERGSSTRLRYIRREAANILGDVARVSDTSTRKRILDKLEKAYKKETYDQAQYFMEGSINFIKDLLENKENCR